MATVELTKENFNSYVEDNQLLIIDFWAPWCGPCRSFAPTYEAVSEQYEDIIFAKVNTEEQQELASTFGIRSIPTLMIFKEQVIVFSQAGSLPESALQDVIGKAKDLDMDLVRAELAKQEQSA